MTLVVDLPFYNTDDESLAGFKLDCFTLLANQQPAHSFIFILPRNSKIKINNTGHLQRFAIKPTNKNIFTRFYWNKILLPAFLKKHQASYFFTDQPLDNLDAQIKQCFFINPTKLFKENFAIQSSKLNKLKKHFEKTALLICSSEYIKKSIATVIPFTQQKNMVIPPGVSPVSQWLSNIQTEEIKNEVAGGTDYFVFYAVDTAIDSIKTVLKAFSLFKSWQRSSMKLVVFLSSKQQAPFEQLILHYKYEKEVTPLFIPNNEKLMQICSVAYAVLFFPQPFSLKKPLLDCMQLNTPVILSHHEFYQSILGNSVLYSKLDDKAISEKMSLLYKDENLRNAHIILAKEWAQKNEWSEIAKKLWTAINTSTET